MKTREIAERIAKEIVSAGEVNPLDGMRKQKVKKLVNDLVSKAAGSSLYRDEYWRGVNNVWNALDKAGIPYTIQKSEYVKERGDVMPTSKVWNFEIPFVNNRGRENILYGYLVASGAGTVDSPLEKYDVTVYVS